MRANQPFIPENYYQLLWIELKKHRPDLWTVMTEIEMLVAGVKVITDVESTDQPSDQPDKARREPRINGEEFEIV